MFINVCCTVSSYKYFYQTKFVITRFRKYRRLSLLSHSFYETVRMV